MPLASVALVCVVRGGVRALHAAQLSEPVRRAVCDQQLLAAPQVPRGDDGEVATLKLHRLDIPRARRLGDVRHAQRLGWADGTIVEHVAQVGGVTSLRGVSKD